MPSPRTTLCGLDLNTVNSPSSIFEISTLSKFEVLQLWEGDLRLIMIRDGDQTWEGEDKFCQNV